MRLLIVDEAYPVCSLASEVSAAVTEHRFDSLDAPIHRLNSDPITHPIAPALEEAMIPQTSDIEKAITALMAA